MACDIVHGHWRDSGNEQPGQTGSAAGSSGLEHIEKMAKKTGAVGQVMVGFLTVNGKDGVGKVVVFVNEDTEA